MLHAALCAQQTRLVVVAVDQLDGRDKWLGAGPHSGVLRVWRDALGGQVVIEDRSFSGGSMLGMRSTDPCD